MDKNQTLGLKQRFLFEFLFISIGAGEKINVITTVKEVSYKKLNLQKTDFTTLNVFFLFDQTAAIALLVTLDCIFQLESIICWGMREMAYDAIG